MLESSSTGSLIASILFCLGYVYSLYIWNIPFIQSHFKESPEENGRDHPKTIKKRFVSVFLTCLGCLLYMRIFIWKSDSESNFWADLGFRTESVITALVLPLLLSMILFAGPLTIRFLMNDWSDVFIYNEWTWWRNIIVGPLSEEIVFRGCMTPLLLAGGYSPSGTVFLSPFIFGAAHLHHIVNHLHKKGVEWKMAVLGAVFQLTYTTVFGAFVTFLFIRTNHVMAAFVVHLFCNFMGFPDIKEALRHPKKILICSMFVVGLISFGLLLFPLTTPEWYENYTSPLK